MLYDERLAHAQRARNEPDGFRAATQADARYLRKVLRRARRRRDSAESTVVAPADTSVGTEAPATVDA